MSWSKATSGPPHHVIDRAEAWFGDVAQTDRAQSMPESVSEQHTKQVEWCVQTIKEFAGSLPYGYHMSASANGSASVGGVLLWNVTMGAYRPVPIPPEDSLGDPLE